TCTRCGLLAIVARDVLAFLGVEVDRFLAEGVKILGFLSWLEPSVMLNDRFFPLVGLLTKPDVCSFLTIPPLMRSGKKCEELEDLLLLALLLLDLLVQKPLLLILQAPKAGPYVRGCETERYLYPVWVAGCGGTLFSVVFRCCYEVVHHGGLVKITHCVLVLVLTWTGFAMSILLPLVSGFPLWLVA
ncbi:hypothetical protein Taro_010620, partial [Colocasia esculenta]|nr:hypothetical protein [Colocasia esculenta]